MTLTYRQLRLAPAHRFPRHLHEAWSFGLVEEGAVRLWRAGAWYLAGQAAATVLSPGEVHEGVADSGTGISYTAVTVSADVVSTTLGLTRMLTFDSLLQPAAAIRRLASAAGAATAEERRERTSAALSLIFRTTGSAITHRVEHCLAVAVKQHLDGRFTEPVHVQTLADRMAVAPATLIRSFRRHYGLSPYAYVTCRRVDLARQLLDSGVSPTEVALRVGFYDQPHLNRHFVRLVGVTPGAYRRG